MEKVSSSSSISRVKRAFLASEDLTHSSAVFPASSKL